MNSGPECATFPPASTAAPSRPVTAHVKHIDAVNCCPVLRFSLDIDLVETAKTVEVVDVGATEKGPHRGIDVRQRHTQLQRLAVVDIEKYLRRARPEQGQRTADFRPRIGRLR